MFRSLSNRSSNRGKHELNAAINNSASSSSRRRISIPLFRTHPSIKKAFSLILNKANFEIRNPPDDQEMYEFIRQTSSEENINTLHRSDSNIPGDTLVNRSHHQSLYLHTNCPLSHRNYISMQRTFSHLKNKIKLTRHEHTNDTEKNNGYLVVENPESDLVLIRDDNIDQQATQHAQPCVQINDVSFDLNQIQFTLGTPITPSLLPPPQQPSLSLSRLIGDNHSNSELEALSTRSSVECGVPQTDLLDIHEIPMSNTIPATSPSSTNSSTHEYTGIDRSLLDDAEYVRAQQLDLERLTIVEIDLSREYNYLQQDLNDELEFNRLYEEASQQNLNLKEELKTLQEEYDRIYLPWSCELCTFLNQEYSVTHRDICEVCEGPSPLKRATLTK